MTVDNTTTALVAGVKRRGFLPVGSGLEAADILEYASDELDVFIPAFLKSIREEYLVATLDLDAAGGVIAAPARAVGAAFRSIGRLMTDGKVEPLNRIEPENAGSLTGQTGDAVGYMFQGNTIILLPAPTSGTVRLAYQQRPGRLVLPEACGLISAVGGTILDSATQWPSTFTTSTPLDVVSVAPNFTAAALDLQPITVDTDEIEFDADIPSTVFVGDYLCLAGETCIPQLPTEVHALLAQATALAIANATGSQRLAAIQKKFDDVLKDTRALLSPRSDGSARVVISRSRIGRWAGGL